ncbi:MAG: hypothetical protein F6J95_020375 [Leptolyngbya sp. SIO1E4]|nr:hypothetical protein [Leptolyngbya sp. SIO1E4]
MLIDTHNQTTGDRTSAATNAIGEEFVAPGHIRAIQKVCEKHGFIATFRDAGRYSITQLEAERACKPHDVLEKSIKDKSIRQFVDPALQNNVTQMVIRLGLRGLIGHWGQNADQQDTLLGIRTIATHEANKKLLDQVGKEGDNNGRAQTYDAAKAAAQQRARDKAKAVAELIKKNEYNSLTPAQKVKKLEEVRLAQQYKTWVSLTYLENNAIPDDALTGDYDMHEMIHAKGAARGGRVVSSSPQEGRFSDLLNEAISKAQEDRQEKVNDFDNHVAPIKNWPANDNRIKPNDYRRPPGSTRHNAYSLIQHGPQHAYGAFIFAGGEELLVQSLLAYDVPVAAFGIPKDLLKQLNGKFARKKHAVETGAILIQTTKELEYLYKLLGVKGWDQAPKQFDGYLKFARVNLASMLRKKEQKAVALRDKPEENDNKRAQNQQKAEKALEEVASRRAIWDYWILALLEQEISNREFKDRNPSKVDELKDETMLANPEKFANLLIVSTRAGYTDTKNKIIKKAWYTDAPGNNGDRPVNLNKWQPHVTWVFDNFIFRSIESFHKSLESKKKKLEDALPDLKIRKGDLDEELKQLKEEKRKIAPQRTADIARKNNQIRRKEEELRKVKQEIASLKLVKRQIELLNDVEEKSKDLRDDLLTPNTGLAVSMSLSSDEDDLYVGYSEAYGEYEDEEYEDDVVDSVPARSFSAAGTTYLNGMKVLFDQAVPVAPVALLPKGQAPTLQDDDATSLPELPPTPVSWRRSAGRQRLRYANRPDPLQRYRKTKQIEGYGYPEQDF